jgi:DNA mismatch repair protein MutS
MQIDPQTLTDLELLRSNEGSNSILDLLDRTRSAGGRAALRRRLSNPSSDAAEINQIQNALRAITAASAAFDAMPTEREILPVLRYLESSVDRAERAGPLRALWLQLRYRDVYDEIIAGVRDTLALLNAVRAFLRALPPELPHLLAQHVARLNALMEPLAVADTGPSIALDSHFRSRHQSDLAEIIAIVHDLDALRSMALAMKHHALVFPDVSASSRLRIVGVRNLFLAATVPNDLVFDDAHTLVFLTGPNMAGKTTYLKSCAVAVLLAHVGMGVPAREMSCPPFDVLFTGFGAADDIHAGLSYFKAEARRVKSIATSLVKGLRCFVLFDEIFKGTNVKDAMDACSSVIGAFALAAGSHFIVSSHLIELADEFSSNHRITLRSFAASIVDGVPRYDFVLHDGATSQRLGMHVLQQEGVLTALEQLRARNGRV